MPQLNTSDIAKQRIEVLLEKLLSYANHELADADHLHKQLSVRWLEDSPTPKLIVKTELRFLAELVFQQQTHAFKETVKQDLLVLRKFLEILEDNRTKTQGSPEWHFTLKLWHKSTQKNLSELRQEWNRRKLLKSKRSKSCGQPSVLDLQVNGSRGSNAANDLPETLAQLEPTSKGGPKAQFLYDAETTGESAHYPYPLHNLPACDYIHFVGRQQPLTHIMELLYSRNSGYRIGVEGIGGVGKTSLVLEVAYRCLQVSRDQQRSPNTPQFDAIIFTSAKLHHLTTRGILPRLRQERTLRQIFRAIAHTLGHFDILSGDLEHQFECIQTILTRQRTLLIVDNLETLTEQQETLSFLYDLPSTVKVIITSCQQAMMDASIRLEPLPEDEGLQFVEQQADIKSVQLRREEAQSLYRATGGIPAAVVYAVGQLASGYLLQEALPRLTVADGDYCRFYFKGLVEPLRGQSAHQVLMALTLFPKPVNREAIASVALAGADPIHALAQLQQRSLVTFQDGRYTTLPLTREYALHELSTHPEFEQSARERWVQWYLKCLPQWGKDNWREWQEYSPLDEEWENIEAVIEWCIEQNRYQQFNQLWESVRGYTHLRGFWDERLMWTNWWITSARRCSDDSALVQGMRDRGWTLMLMGRPESLQEAEELFLQSWSLRDHVSLNSQLELAIERAILALHQRQPDTAYLRLQEARTLLQQVDEEPRHLHQFIRIQYYEAEAWYYREDYDQSRTLYSEVLEQSRLIQWQQVEVYTLNWLADIALKQGHLIQAESLLNQSLPLAEQHQDKRSIAFHHRSWALLEHLRGNLPQCQHWSREAKRYFEDLGMDAEVREMQIWSEMGIALNSSPGHG